MYKQNFKPVYYTRQVDDLFALLRSPMRKKVTIHCLFLDILLSRSENGLKHLFTTNHLLGEYILTSIVAFTTNMKLVWFLLCYLEHFQLSLTFLGFTLKTFKGKFEKECVSHQTGSQLH